MTILLQREKIFWQNRLFACMKHELILQTWTKRLQCETKKEQKFIEHIKFKCAGKWHLTQSVSITNWCAKLVERVRYTRKYYTHVIHNECLCIFLNEWLSTWAIFEILKKLQILKLIKRVQVPDSLVLHSSKSCNCCFQIIDFWKWKVKIDSVGTRKGILRYNHWVCRSATYHSCLQVCYLPQL